MQAVQRRVVAVPEGSPAAPVTHPNATPFTLPSLIKISSAHGCSFAAASLRDAREIALDCEGASLSRTGRLCMVQVSFAACQANCQLTLAFCNPCMHVPANLNTKTIMSV